MLVIDEEENVRPGSTASGVFTQFVYPFWTRQMLVSIEAQIQYTDVLA